MGKVLNLFSDPHDAIERLMPWYITGQLDAQDTARVEAHLLDCPNCLATLADEHAIARLVVQDEGGIDRGWAKLRERVEQPAATDFAPSGLTEPPSRQRHGMPRWAKIAAAVILGISSAITIQPKPDAQYHALGDAVIAPAGNVVVMFRPGIDKEALDQAIRDSGALRVNGPTAAGAYVLRSLAAHQALVLRRLRQNPNVTLAEPLDSNVEAE
jgi:anti-sigma factor RsiW